MTQNTNATLCIFVVFKYGLSVCPHAKMQYIMKDTNKTLYRISLEQFKIIQSIKGKQPAQINKNSRYTGVKDWLDLALWGH